MKVANVIIKAILSFLLFLCLLRMPYGYYEFMRIVAIIGFAVLAVDGFKNKKTIEAVILIGLIFVFQPLVKIHFGRTLWNVIDVIVAISLIVSIFINESNHRRNNE